VVMVMVVFGGVVDGGSIGGVSSSSSGSSGRGSGSCISTVYIYNSLWLPLAVTPFPQIDIIRVVVIVWRVRGKTIRSVLCNIVCNNCARCDAHTYEQTNTSLDWVLSHWAHFTVLDSFLYCVLLCVVCMIA